MLLAVMVLAALAVPFLPLATAVALDPVPEAAVMVVTEVDLDVRVVGPDGRDVGDREAGLNATAVHGDEAPFEADMSLPITPSQPAPSRT